MNADQISQTQPGANAPRTAMNLNRHARDAAWELTADIVRVFAPLLRDEELIDAHREVFDLLLPGLTAVLVRYDRERARVPAPTTEEQP